ncbi:MAG: KUP/HAK/KT family potassium transporter [Nitrospinae bacterium]|nr:KUP/HAK/KT family potassium transporter [Nitrospinota bacterium]
MSKDNQSFKGVIESFGLVFGDIGTSPIYTLTVIILLLKPTAANILGVLSLITWTMTILVSMQYAWLAMSLSRKGEGGAIVLKEILVSLLKTGRSAAVIGFLSFISVSLMIGDGVITPAISILSAVEGLRLIPMFEDIGQEKIVLASMSIAVALFTIQRRGTDKIAGAFGPVMVVWFLALSVSGVVSITQYPQVLKAVNPYYAVDFLSHHGLAGFFILSEVILCATGGEALYADMGHIGAKPIIRAWFFVFIALLLSYLGQGAHVITHPEAKNVLFEMVNHQSAWLYIPFLMVSVMATIIASQAMISGMFSIVYQGISINMFPRMKVDFTSSRLRSQIYIGFVNWFLLLSVLFVMNWFGESSKLAAAYGMAVTGAMTITGIMMTWIFWLNGSKGKSAIAFTVALVDLAYLLACAYKIPHGGYWSFIIASAPLFVILIFKFGQERLYRALRPIDMDLFVEQFKYIYESQSRIKGTALYFIRGVNKVPPYIAHCMFKNGILYEDNVFVSLTVLDIPFGVEAYFRSNPTEGLRIFEIHLGYQEVMEMETILREAGIKEKTIFYGVEEIVTTNFFWKTFSVIKSLSPPFVQFYKLPSNRLHGVVTRVEM